MAEKKFKEETLNNVFTQVTQMIEAGMLIIPNDYSVENALRHAWFRIQETQGNKGANYKPALEICTGESIALSLLKMCTDGLTPAKNQCGFLVRKKGDNYELNYMKEYQGNIALAKRYSGVTRVDAQVVYEGEKYEAYVSDGIKSVIHEPSMEHIDFDKIKGAYCVITEKDGTKQTVEMSFSQIKQAWAMGAMNGLGDVHKNFADQMCLKSVINRACKPYINSSSDAAILPEGGRKGLAPTEQKQTIAIEDKPEKLQLEPNKEFEENQDSKPETKTPENKEAKQDKAPY